jgi:maleylacetate reductase
MAGTSGATTPTPAPVGSVGGRATPRVDRYDPRVDDATALSGRILHPPGEGVVFGPGAVGQRLAGLIARCGARRPFVVTTRSVAGAGLAAEVIAALGVDPVGVFEGSREHTPAPVVLAAATAAAAVGADCLVSVGGSSVVDLTKGVALVLSEGEDRITGPARRPDRTSGVSPKLPHIAVPTTLSGAEFTSAAGITDPTTGVKRGYVDPVLAPRWVVLDPELTRATPPALWAATGMKVLADTIETLCSPRATPLSDAVATTALAILAARLAPSTADPDDVVGRGRCQFAVAMTLPNLVGVGVGLVAALRHQLGGGLGVAHGVASTIVLPHVVRWNAPACAPALQHAARALGASGFEDLVAAIERLTDELGLPNRLRDVGVARGDLARIAEHVLGDASLATNPRPVDDVAVVMEVLDAAY